MELVPRGAMTQAGLTAVPVALRLADRHALSYTSCTTSVSGVPYESFTNAKGGLPARVWLRSVSASHAGAGVNRPRMLIEPGLAPDIRSAARRERGMKK